MSGQPLRVVAAIPCYNGAETVADTIRSLLNQTRAPDEVLVLDDGSTDDSEKVAREAGARVISVAENIGLSAGRNHLWQSTDAEIVVYLDADTVAHDDLIERLLDHYSEADVGGVGGQAVESRIESIYDKWRKFTAAQTLGDELIDDSELLFGLCCSYRRSALEGVSGFDQFFRSNGEDVDICIRMRQAGYRLVYEPAAVVEHKRTDTFRSLMRMLYRYEFFAHLSKMRNGARIENHYAAFSLRLRFLFDRFGQIMRTGRGLKFALIDMAALAPVFAACWRGKRSRPPSTGR
ncbi:glycosyltransferase [bacterium]|nr:glycosyltransferase [bacterium]